MKNRNRTSLADILREDEQLEQKTPSPPPQKEKAPPQQESHQQESHQQERPKQKRPTTAKKSTQKTPLPKRPVKKTKKSRKVEVEEDRSDFVKATITLPPEMHEHLLDISRERRRNKEPYTISALVREALEHWLKKQR